MMKKTLIAAAVTTAFAGSAIAQVTISGVLDYGHSDVKSTGATNVTTKTSSSPGEQQSGWSSSRFNFAAVEDLGGGLKAGMQVQQGLTTATTGNRDTFVFVEGGFGQVRLGFQDPSIQLAFGAFGVTGTTNGAGTLDSTGHDLLAGSFGTGSFARQNGLRYTTPSFNNFTLSADYSNDSVSASNLNGKTGGEHQGVVLNYRAGNLSFAVGQATQKTKAQAVTGVQAQAFFFNSTSNATLTQTTASTLAAGTVLSATTGFTGTAPAVSSNQSLVGIVTTAGVSAVAATEQKATLNMVGAAYNFGVAELKGTYVTRKDDTAGVQQSDISGYTLGLNVPMGNLRLFASYYDAADDRTVAAADDRDLKGNQFGLTYSFSKRTLAYLYSGENKATTKATGANVQKTEGTYFGLSHSF